MKEILLLLLICGLSSCGKETEPKPNILFIMMDDLGYGQLGVNNDTLSPTDFDPFFIHLVDSLQGYLPQTALEYSRQAVPSLTALAQNGIVFRNAYVSSSLCAPSRLGIATGIHQNRFGVYSNGDGEAGGFPPGSLLVEQLKNAGYRTAHVGKWHIGSRNQEVLNDILKRHGLSEKTAYRELALRYPEIYNEVENSGYYGSVIAEHHPLNNGFEYYFGYNTWASQFYHSTLVWENFAHAGKQKGYNTDVFTQKALDFMKEQEAGAQPFFLQLHYHAVHDSLEPRAPDRYLAPFTSPFPDLNNFYAHMYGVDQNVGKIIAYLKSEGLYENTLIIFTSDNGAMAAGRHKGHKIGSPLPGNAPFSGHKGNLYQGGIRVPMFIHWPEKIREPFVSNHLVSTLDILPTAIEAATGKAPENLDGKSLIPLQNNPALPPIHDYLFGAGVHASAWGFLIEKTTKDHITERPFAPPAWVLIQKDFLLRFTGTLPAGVYKEYINGREPILELFDLNTDPAETQDLAEIYPERVAQMSRLYYEEAATLPPPVVWEREKWEEVIQPVEP
ncbi:MAG: sulfatase-like hydrolase/transferase [Bacteroidota bacterium]